MAIRLRLYGGLGNQIFQVAAALLVAKENCCSVIEIDQSGLLNYEVPRSLDLIKFFDFEITGVTINYSHSRALKYRLPKILSFDFLSSIFLSDSNFSVRKRMAFSELLMDGYFQECLNQSDFEKELQILKTAFKVKQLTTDQSKCVIHIRGGDFIGLGWNEITGENYYKKAIQYMQEFHNVDVFEVVTDDIEYAEDLLSRITLDYEIIGLSLVEDFYLIGSFRYRILSSSTFAFWASALGKNDNSIVLMPSCWIPSHDRKIYIPNEVRL